VNSAMVAASKQVAPRPPRAPRLLEPAGTVNRPVRNHQPHLPMDGEAGLKN
jgi:hypothetical protein